MFCIKPICFIIIAILRDLACQYALSFHQKINLKAILIDYPPNADYGDPIIQAVHQLNYITGQQTPVGIGISTPMSDRDNSEVRDLQPGSGIRLVLKVLEEAKQPVAIHIVRSCRDIAIAGKLRPDLFRNKCKAIYLNAGSNNENEKLEYNVELDPFSTAPSLICPVRFTGCLSWSTIRSRLIFLGSSRWENIRLIISFGRGTTFLSLGLPSKILSMR
jgi:hypothetical protein